MITYHHLDGAQELQSSVSDEENDDYQLLMVVQIIYKRTVGYRLLFLFFALFSCSNFYLELAILLVGHVLYLSEHLLKTVFSYTSSNGNVPLQKSEELTNEAHQATYQHGADEASVGLNAVYFEQQVKIRRRRIVSINRLKVLLSEVAICIWWLHIRLRLYHWHRFILLSFIFRDILNISIDSIILAKRSIHTSLNIMQASCFVRGILANALKSALLLQAYRLRRAQRIIRSRTFSLNRAVGCLVQNRCLVDWQHVDEVRSIWIIYFVIAMLRQGCHFHLANKVFIDVVVAMCHFVW